MLNHLFRLSLPNTLNTFVQSRQCLCRFHTRSSPLTKNNKLFSFENSNNLVVRRISRQPQKKNVNNMTILYYVTAFGVVTVGCTYAAVPLYRMFCQVRFKTQQGELGDLMVKELAYHTKVHDK